jgi:hypothetical protein
MFGFDLISDRAGDLEELTTRPPADADATTLTALAGAMRPLLERLADAVDAADRG